MEGRDTHEEGNETKPLIEQKRFLDPTNPDDKRERVWLASYPRSGNTYMRLIMEQVTGIHTGTPAPPNSKKGVQALYDRGFIAEGITDDRVWMVKTHFPERARPGGEGIRGHKVMLMMRNPFDSIDSYFNLRTTGTHDQSLEEEEYTRLAELFDEHVNDEVACLKKYFVFWKNADIPCLFVKYEDLKANFKDLATEMVQFILNKKDISGTEEQKRLDMVIAEGLKNLYKPRVGTNFNSLHHYSKDQIRLILTQLREEMIDFGFLTDELFDQPCMAEFKEEFYSPEVQGRIKDGRGEFTTRWIQDHNRELIDTLDARREAGEENEVKKIGGFEDYCREKTMMQIHHMYMKKGDNVKVKSK